MDIKASDFGLPEDESRAVCNWQWKFDEYGGWKICFDDNVYYDGYGYNYYVPNTWNTTTTTTAITYNYDTATYITDDNIMLRWDMTDRGNNENQ